MNHISKPRALRIASALIMLVCLFLPWAQWRDSLVSGYHFPSGKFFEISAVNFGLANPFPRLSFSFYLFWLIVPLLLVSVLLSVSGKKDNWFAIPAAILMLSLVTIFFLFTKTLIDLGAGRNVFEMLRWPAYLAFIFSIVLILASPTPVNWLKKIGLIAAGPVFAFIAFLVIQKTVWNETFKNTEEVSADYRLKATELLNEFALNDSSANMRYKEKIIEVEGAASSVEVSADSVTTIQFSDSSGSHLVFSLDRSQYQKAASIKPGEIITLKGSCSGSIFSEILGSRSISFKRSTFINKKS